MIREGGRGGLGKEHDLRLHGRGFERPSRSVEGGAEKGLPTCCLTARLAELSEPLSDGTPLL